MLLTAEAQNISTSCEKNSNHWFKISNSESGRATHSPPGVENDYLTYDIFNFISCKVNSFAAGLLAIGIEKGDRVGIWGPNTREWVVTQFATARIGAILVNVNPAYRTMELEYALKKVYYGVNS